MKPITKLKKYWNQFSREILLRPMPHAILSWRYFLPRQSRMVLLHKQVFKQAWPPLPRPFWWLIACYSYLLWYFWFGWLQILRTWQKIRPKYAKETTKSALRQCFELWVLTFGHSTPPHFYYRYELYRFPEKQWLDFIYTHELPQWHLVMSLAISPREQQLISDKQAFAKEMQIQGLPAITTTRYFAQGEQLDPAVLFTQQSLFLKPVIGSRKQGCYELLYQPNQKNHQLTGEHNSSQNRQKILTILQQQINMQAYLAQPLLCNHAQLASYSPDGRLLTIRLITVRQQQTWVLCAALEVPIDQRFASVLPFPVNPNTGEILSCRVNHRNISDDLSQRIKHLPGHHIPNWRTVLQTVRQAHAVFPNMHTIGWDLAITDSGVKLLEGNFNWAVAEHQLGGQPLLTNWTKHLLKNYPATRLSDIAASANHRSE